MSLTVLAEQCKELDVYEQRYNSEDYKELVFFAADLPKWQKVLEAQLGPPEKQPWEQPNNTHLELTQNFGGIFRGQTLFKAQLGDSHVMAMIWPWEDDKYMTLKIASYS